ncbi:MAG TPA: NmrA family NAD(P)-binding protein [Nitrospirota bacterium]|nr:NmrA family NAD(P)-binding protein [Nitrospirota bacterium]
MKILVTGCTGKVGIHVMRGLARQGVNVRCMTRNRSAARALGLPCGVREYVADFNSPTQMSEVFDRVDAVFLLVPVGPDETKQGLVALEAARNAGVQKIVYMSVNMPTGSEVIPHFSSKIPIEKALMESGIPYTILRPNNFFQNDIVLNDVIMNNGLYPTPLGLIGLNRVDTRDIADGAINALLKTGHEGLIYGLHGPDRLTGRDIAKIYSLFVGRDVRYAGDDLDTWESTVKNILPIRLVSDLRIMYKFFQDHGMTASMIDLDTERELLGHMPRSFKNFVMEITYSWKTAMTHAA